MTEQQYADLLDSLIAKQRKECRHLEFKSNYQDANTLGEYISALSNGATLDNEDYGYLFFGIDDKSLELIGSSFDPYSQKFSFRLDKSTKSPNQYLELGLRQYVTPKINFSIDIFTSNNGKRIVVFKIPAAREEPTYFMGKAYVRVDSCKTDLRNYPEWMRQIYNSRRDWSAEVISDATINDLHPEAIAIAKQGYKERNPDISEDVDNWTLETFLDRAKITIDGKITRTALLLLGRPESRHKIGHIAQIVWQLNTPTESPGEVFDIPFIISTSNVLGKIRNYQFKIYPNTSLIPAEIWKYDTRNILEGLHNCIAHQDYLKDERIVVTEEPDRLLFENGGSFFEGRYEDYIEGRKTPRRYRNPFLVNAMLNIKMIDTRGLGIHWMFERQRKSYLPMPEYDTSNPDSVKLIIPGNIINMDYSIMLMNSTNLDLSTVYLLDKVQKHQSISDEAILLLRKKHLIEGRKPNIYISKQVAKITHSEVEYTKMRGLSEGYYQEAILNALRQHGPLKKQFFVDFLFDKLPENLNKVQKLAKIKNLLSKLRAQGKICYSRDNGWELVK